MHDPIPIRDIARTSGVPVAMVSLVLNDQPGISQEIRARVLEAAEALGYPLRPVLDSARPLRRLGLVIKTVPGEPLRANAFYSHILAGIEEACQRAQIALAISELLVDDANRPMKTSPLLQTAEADGLLVVGTFVDEALLALLGDHLPPIVLVDAYTNVQTFDSVVSDNYQAAYNAVEYLIRKGHRHIGLIGSESNAYPSLKQRRGGYLRALHDNDVPDSYIANFNMMRDTAHAHAERLLIEHPQISALFGVNDWVALQAMEAAQKLGRRIPDDLSIIGYDDIEPSAHSNPPLTTMHVDAVAMGHAAVLLLTNRLENPTSAPMTLTVHCQLTERMSVRDIP